MRLIRYVFAISVALLPAAVLAQAYGQGAYSSTEYGTGVLSVGAIALPNTGTTWVSLIGILIAIATASVVILRRLRSAHDESRGVV
jgi:LPXTG-motif cell wall-anchored protein